MLLCSCIKSEIEEILRKNLNSFRRNRSATPPIPTMHRISGVCPKILVATLLFADFSKTFHSIHKGKMEQILQAYGLHKESATTITIFTETRKSKFAHLMET